MRRSKRLAWVLAAAAGLAVTGLVQAQYQLRNDGRMRESNNMIGSGGLNHVQNTPRITQGNFNNAIITGDVTGGRQFRGAIDYTNPRAFRGQTAGVGIDNFVRQSSAAPIGGVLQNNAQAVQPYFGPSNAVAPPSGFVEQSLNTGAYVPGKTATRGPGDLRLGQTLSSPSTVLPLPGQLVMPGPVDPNTQSSTVITASPLFGVRQLNPAANVADSAFLQHSMGGGLGDVRVDPALAEKLRRELSQSSGTMDSGPLDQQVAEPVGRATPSGRETTDPNAPMRQGFDSPQNEPLNQSSILQSNDRAAAGQLNSDLATGAGIRQRLLNAPKIRSTQYTELEKRLQQYRSVQEMNELASAREYNEQRRARDAADAAKAGSDVTGLPRMGGTAGVPNRAGPGPGPQGPAAQPGGTSTLPPMTVPTPGPAPANDQIAIVPPAAPAGAVPPVVDRAPVNPPAAPPAPLKIDSLAQGVQGQALADLLKEAEDLMRNGSYSAALEKYDVAELVAPNSPLVQLGRANVELGRTYYASATASLRRAFMQDQALLMGQYNLRNLLGQERLEIIVRDLRTIAERESTEARPVFLLAYIDYNTANERRAAAYLDLAEKRAGGNDPLYPLIRKYWSLPKDAAPAELNK